MKNLTIPAILLEQKLLSPPIEREFENFSSLHKGSADNLLRWADYARWSVVFERIPKNSSLLDVGVGAGQFVRAAAASGMFRRVEGLDAVKHSKFVNLEKNPVRITYANAEDMPFEDGEFDYITAMEIIEHLDTSVMEASIREMRRVASKGFFITVPYCEREPLPTYHKQRFDYERLMNLFPSAFLSLCVNGRSVPWVMVEELY